MTTTLCRNIPKSNPKRRDKLVIMAEILNIARRGALKTQIMYKANLSFSQLKEYLSVLVATQLLTKMTCNRKELFIATPKGQEFLDKHQQLNDMLN